jgi:hypothetical protein
MGAAGYELFSTSDSKTASENAIFTGGLFYLAASGKVSRLFLNFHTEIYIFTHTNIYIYTR